MTGPAHRESVRATSRTRTQWSWLNTDNTFTMPLLTHQEYQEFISLYGEARHLFEVGPLRESFRRTVWIQRVLHETDATWWQRQTASLVALENTWIMTLVREVSQQDNCHEWLEERESHDNFTHPLKTPDRMAEIDEISGYARIMLSSTVAKTWIHPVIKSYWFALAWQPGQREANGTLRDSTVIPSGHHITVFPF